LGKKKFNSIVDLRNATKKRGSRKTKFESGPEKKLDLLEGTEGLGKKRCKSRKRERDHNRGIRENDREGAKGLKVSEGSREKSSDGPEGLKKERAKKNFRRGGVLREPRA